MPEIKESSLRETIGQYLLVFSILPKKGENPTAAEIKSTRAISALRGSGFQVFKKLSSVPDEFPEFIVRCSVEKEKIEEVRKIIKKSKEE